jgi:uncharacterized DUF497 family protein
MHFTWDPSKAIANLRKHCIAFEEAITVFLDPLALIVTDDMHSDRAILIGESIKHRVLLVVFIEINGPNIRIISARRATAHERKQYEEGS